MNGMELKELLDTVSEKVRKETTVCYIYCTQEKYKTRCLQVKTCEEAKSERF